MLHENLVYSMVVVALFPGQPEGLIKTHLWAVWPMMAGSFSFLMAVSALGPGTDTCRVGSA